MDRILVVDDEENYCRLLGHLLEAEGYEVITSRDPLKAVEIVETGELDLVITDLKMPKIVGTDFLSLTKKQDPHLPVILVTAYGTIENAVQAMKEGAFDYLVKPFRNDELRLTVRNALELSRAHRINRQLESQLLEQCGKGGLVGKAPAMREVYSLVRRVAPARSTVLISGESGTGKELVARSIHLMSPRSGKPFISLNCAAITDTLLESELFGHERGSFTGATHTKKGKFEVADGGTLFLDEVGDMPAALQSKLLRVLQEGEFERVGGNRLISTDVRLIAATNKDLPLEVEQGRFRQDLFFRLNVVAINLPPLRERMEDFPLLVRHFLGKFAGYSGGKPCQLLPDVLDRMMQYFWPGNVRELENVVERMVVLADGHEITEELLPPEIRAWEQEEELRIEECIAQGRELVKTLEEVESRMIMAALRRNGYVYAQAARDLGLSRSHLQYKLKRLKMETGGHKSKTSRTNP